jgi:hypothetical protein
MPAIEDAGFAAPGVAEGAGVALDDALDVALDVEESADAGAALAVESGFTGAAVSFDEQPAKQITGSNPSKIQRLDVIVRLGFLTFRFIGCDSWESDE